MHVWPQNLAATKVASNAYGAPYAKNAHFRHGGFKRFLLVGKSPKPLESQVPFELRTLRALYFSLRIHSVSLPGILQDNLSEGNPFRTFRYMDFTISDYDIQHTCLIT